MKLQNVLEMFNGIILYEAHHWDKVKFIRLVKS